MGNDRVYVLVELPAELQQQVMFPQDLPGLVAVAVANDAVRTADVTCFDGCQGLDFKSLTDLLS